MAEAKPNGNEDTDLEKTINCPICFENMLDSRTLYPCVHTFCSSCVDLLRTKEEHGIKGIECPVCRGFVNEKEIRKNRLMDVLINLVSQEDQTLSESGEMDSICVQCGGFNVNSRCLHCNIDLCKNCRERHCRLPGYQIHKVVSLSEIQNKDTLKEVIVYCNKHSSELVRANCVECNTAICSVCKLGEHDTHKSESLQSALTRYRQVIREAMNDFRKTEVQMRKHVSFLKKQQVAIKQNEMQIQSQLNTFKEGLITDVVSKINKEYGQLSGEIKTNTGAMLKEIDLRVEEMEHKLTCDESIVTWTQAILANTDGSGLLIELQAGLLQKMQQIQKFQPDFQTTKPKMYSFKHATLLTKENNILMGKLVAEDDEFADSIESTDSDFTLLSPTKSDRSLTSVSLNENFRIMNTDLTSVKAKQLSPASSNFDIGCSSLRICLYHDKIWIPCITENIIKVYSQKGEWVQNISLLLDGVEQPRSLYPLRKDYIALAAESGLYIMDSKGGIKVRKHKGRFNDVYIQDRLMAALDCWSKTVYLWDVKHTSKPKLSFSVTLTKTNVSSTLLVHNDSVYVCDYAGHYVQQYGLEGKSLKQIGKEGNKVPGSLYFPFISGVDSKGNLLIVDQGNNRIQIWSDSKGWKVLDLKTNDPYDMILVKNFFYILNGVQIDKKISRYKYVQ